MEWVELFFPTALHVFNNNCNLFFSEQCWQQLEPWPLFFIFSSLRQKLACLATCALAGFSAYSHRICWNLWVMDVTARDVVAFSCGQLLQQWTTSWVECVVMQHALLERMSWLDLGKRWKISSWMTAVKQFCVYTLNSTGMSACVFIGTIAKMSKLLTQFLS